MQNIEIRRFVFKLHYSNTINCRDSNNAILLTGLTGGNPFLNDKEDG